MSGPVRFPLVDSLRAFGALAVLATHAGALAGLYTKGSTAGAYVSKLDVGVAVFFLVSGFLLYRPFARARIEGTPRPKTGPYAWRRFLRIAPGYWVALTLGVIALSIPGVITASGLPTFYLFGQGFRTETIGGGLAQGWTLTVEISFYAFLPLFALAMSRVRGSTRAARLRGEYLAAAGLIVVGVGYKVLILLTSVGSDATITSSLIALPAYLDQFGLGMLLAVLSIDLAEREALPRPLRVIDRHPWLPWLGALAAFWAVSTQVGIDSAFYAPMTKEQYLLRHFLYAMVALGLLLPAVIGDPGRGFVRRLMAHPWVVYLGLVSYGVYLYNLLVMEKLNGWGAADLLPVGRYLSLALIGAVVTVAVASLSWYVLERRALGLKRVFSRT